jgi:hypothetical protein
MNRQQSTTNYPIIFLMVDSTDHVSPKTGLTPTVTLSKDGGAFAAAAGAVTEISNGRYALAGNAADRNTLGTLSLHATATGADPVDMDFMIVAFDPFSALADVKAKTDSMQFTTSGANKFVRVDIQAIGGSVSGDAYFLHNMAQDYGVDNKLSASVADAVSAKTGNGHIPVVASVRSDERYMVAAQFTKAGVAVQPGSAPTCAADCIVVSDQYPTGHTINFGTLTLQYNSTTKSYYALGTLPSALIGSQAGMLYCKFHTDDATVDAQDVTMAVAVNMDIYNPPLVESVLAAIEAKTRMLGAMSMTLQTPVVTVKEFKIIRGDSYTNDTPFPNRPLQLTCDEVPYDLAALMETPHAVRVHLKTTTDEIVVKPYSVVSQGLNSYAYTIIFGFSDEVTRSMTAGKYEWEVKAYYQRTASPANYDVVTQGKGTYTVEEPVYDGASGPKTPTTG